MPEFSQKDASLEASRNLNESRARKGKHLAPYQRFMESLQSDPKVQAELALGKRVGFYTLRGELGSGNFSRVKAGVHALTKEKVAIKILDKKKMDKKTKRLLCREISSMEKLHHPNIVHLYEVIHTDTKLHLVMEYASGGELFTKLSTQGMMNENDAKTIFAQILSAVRHMHQHNVVHRDLKAENVFYSEKKHVKVGDFGFSTEAKSKKQALNTFCGSPPYAAPELFRDSFYYGESVDVWALGIILYFAVTGTMPFRAETVGKLKKRILSGDYTVPSHVSTNCKSLIRCILKPSPDDRMTTSEILASDWLANVVYPKPMGYYRLEPSQIDLTCCRPEEEYALRHLDKLGLGQDELKKFRFQLDSTPSPFSWDSKVETSNTQLTVRRSLFGGSRSSHSNLQDHLEINESAAVVGTYRILLLRAHQRLDRSRADSGCSATSNGSGSGSASTWLCSMCEVDRDSSSLSFSSNRSTVIRNDCASTPLAATQTDADRNPSPTPTTRRHSETVGDEKKIRTKRNDVSSNRRKKSTPVKSRFCSVL